MAKLTLAEERKQADALRDTAQKVVSKSDNAKILAKGTKPRRKLSNNALQHWFFIIDNAPEGQLLMTDIPILEQYCEVLCKLEDLTKLLGDEPVGLENQRGTMVVNPYYNVFNTMSVLCATLAARLRLVPAMRQLSQSEKNSQDLGKNKDQRQQPVSKRSHLLFGGSGNIVPISDDINAGSEDVS